MASAAAEPRGSLKIPKDGLEGDLACAIREVPKKLIKQKILGRSNGRKSQESIKSTVLLNNQIEALNAELTGGKGSSLMLLNVVKGITVPEFFCVTTVAFKGVVANMVDYDDLDRVCALWSENPNEQTKAALFKTAEKIRETITGLEMPVALLEEVKHAYKRLSLSKYAVACRSSATTEDTEDASFAGQHDTFLNQRSFEAVVHSIRECWASIFTDRAIEYRIQQDIDHRKACMGVVVQRMVDPDVSGTAFSMELSTSYPAIHIAALYGLGEGLVSGELTSDEWLVDPLSGKILKEVVGSKTHKYTSNGSSSGIALQELPEALSSVLCMKEKAVHSIASSLKKIQRVYQHMLGYDHVDTEIAVKDGHVYFLQCRPVVNVQISDLSTVASEAKEDALKSQVITRGKYSLLGAVQGKIKVVRDFEALVRGDVSIEPEDIVVTAKTSNYWNQYLTNLRGIITIEGSPTAHPMLIGRERALCVICGCSPAALDRLEQFDGEWATMDGISKAVFAGRLPLEQASAEDLQENFKVVKVEDPLETSEHLVLLEQMGRVKKYDGSDKYWVHQPNTFLSPAWRQLMLQQYATAIAHVKAARRASIRTSFRVPDHRRDDTEGKVASEYLTYAELILKRRGLYTGMSLRQCSRLKDRIEGIAQRYLEMCASFAAEKSVESWKAYQEAFVDLHGALYTHHAFRMYIKRRATLRGKELGVSQLHFDEFQNAEFVQIEAQEDDYFRRDINALAVQLVELDVKEPPTLDSLEEISSVFYERFREVANRYRLSKHTDVAQEPPVAELLEKVNETFEQVKESGSQLVDTSENLRVFLRGVKWLPDAAFNELRKWATLDVEARVQMCNLHHWKVRGNNIVREALTSIGGKEIFDLPTTDAIEEVIAARAAV